MVNFVFFLVVLVSMVCSWVLVSISVCRVFMNGDFFWGGILGEMFYFIVIYIKNDVNIKVFGLGVFFFYDVISL